MVQLKERIRQYFWLIILRVLPLSSSERLNRLFALQTSLRPNETAAFIDRAKALFPKLQSELKRLMEADRAGGILDSTLDLPVSTASSIPLVFRPGQKPADRFEIVRYLGKGGMGQVYQAKDCVLGCDVALKAIRPEIASDPGMFERFKREVMLAREVNDEHLCRIFELYHSHAPPFLVMEYLAGGTLADRLASQEEGTPVGEAFLLLEQIVQGLHAMHRKQIIHGDLKPGNVMFTEPPGGAVVAKITDFGLAHSGDSGSLNQGLGTPLYMAPEQQRGGKASVSSDIYALGLVMYEIVTGAQPEFNEIPGLLSSRRLTVSDLDPKWKTAILRCLEHNPRNRFATAPEVIEAIRTDRDWSQRNRRAVLAVVASQLCVALLSRSLRVYTVRPAVEGSSVLLTSMENRTQDAELDSISDVLRAELEQSAHFNLLDPIGVRKILSMMRRPADQKLDPPTAREVAWRAGAPLVVYGEVSQSAQGYMVSLRLELVKATPDYPAQTWPYTVTAPTKNELFHALHKGSRWVRQTVGDLSLPDRPPEEITTSSWQALKFFTQANEKVAAGERQAAVLLLKDALKKDPEFAMAYMRLGDILVSLKNWEGFHYWQQAIRLSEKHRLSLREELRIKGQYYDDSGDLRAAEGAYRSFVAYYPNDYLPPFLLGITLADLEREQEAIYYLNQAAAKRPPKPSDFKPAAHLAMLYMDLRQFDNARAEVEKVRACGQPEWCIWLGGTLKFLQEDFQEALREVAVLSVSPETEWRSPSYTLRACWLSELGCFAEAGQLLQEGTDYDRPRHLNGAEADKHLLLAYLAYRKSECQVARRECLVCAALEKDPNRLARAGTLLARSGYLADARYLLSAMPGNPDVPVLRMNRWRLEGEIVLQEGNIAHAVTLLTQAAQLAPSRQPKEYLARALERAGDAAGALTRYKQIVDRPLQLWSIPNWEFPGSWADALFRSAVLARQLGSSEAQTLESRYLRLRKNADSGIPDVQNRSNDKRQQQQGENQCQTG